ncbi:MAG: tetratricopeptide (TPR) repeat protein [Planctomycetota bacterium]
MDLRTAPLSCEFVESGTDLNMLNLSSKLLACSALALSFLFAACSDEGQAQPSTEAGAVAAGSNPKQKPISAPAAPSADRCELKDVVAARLAIEDGRIEDARPVLSARAAELGVEKLLLEARSAAVLEDDIRVSQLIEQAREQAPKDARVYATSAELHAASGRLETSQAEVLRGSQICGMTPELERARGVQLICTSGASEAGMRLLETAHQHDSDLPFINRPLCQAYRLVGQKKLGMGLAPEALRHARLALKFGPLDFEARRLMAECYVGVNEHALAAEFYQDLVDGGEPLQVELRTAYKNAGIAALMLNDRAASVAHFLAARERGMSDADLGTGQTILEGEAVNKVMQARAQNEAGEFARAKALAKEALEIDPNCQEAREELAGYATLEGMAALTEQAFDMAFNKFELALDYDPESLEAHNFMGHTLIELGRPAEAAKAWSWVVDTARIEKLELPEPVHLLLAKAQTLSGNVAESRATLEEYLTLEPDGAHVGRTRELLAVLPREELPDGY